VSRVWFSPHTALHEVVQDHLTRCTRSVFAATYVAPGPEVAAGLLAAAGRGCRVRVVVDAGPVVQNPVSVALAEHVDVRVVQPAGAGTMHHKFVLLDDREVLTGSYNLASNPASRNALVLVRDTAVVQEFAAEAERLWALPLSQHLLLPWQADVLIAAALEADPACRFLKRARQRCQARGWMTTSEEGFARSVLRRAGRPQPTLPTVPPGADERLGW
jgi:phosphatidylserine/phosphatidylglycerophosphate/cardiolipin synthase-like enzyme